MGCKSTRSVVGDILVHEEGADILVLEDMADFILLHFAKAGRKQISLTREPLAEIKAAAHTEKEGDGFGRVAPAGQRGGAGFWPAAQRSAG